MDITNDNTIIENQNTEGGVGQEGEQTPEQSKTYTEQEVDRRVSLAIKKREEALKNEFNQTLESKVQEMIKEQKRLSQLSQEEQQREEIDKRLKDIEARERRLNNESLKSDMRLELAKLGLDTEAVSLLVRENDEDTETALQRLNVFKSVVEKATKDVLQKKLQDSAYVPSTGDNAELTVDAFNKMTIAEKTELYNKNNALYNKLKQEATKK